MRVMKLAEPGRFEPATIEPPAPMEGRVLIDVRAVALCGSDLAAYRGTHPAIRPPTVLGHEFAGVVVDTGGSADLANGDRVCVDPTFGCGVCRLCRSGRSNICRQYTVMGRTLEFPGGMAGRVSVPPDHVHPLPDGVAVETGALVQPVSVGYHAAVDRGAVSDGTVVLVAGAGAIGASIVMASVAAGARVIVVDIVESRLRLAAELGAGVIVNARAEDLADVVAAETSGFGVDVALEASGARDDELLRSLIRATARGGTVVVVGAKGDRMAIQIGDIKYGEKTITGSQAHPQTFPRVIAGIESGALPADRLISHRFPFSAVADAFDLLDRGDGHVMKVVLAPD